MKILITGGSGFIGRNLQEWFAGRYEVHAPSHTELDLLDSDKVRDYLKAQHFDVVIYAATWDATRNAKKDTSLILENNLRMFFNLSRVSGDFGKMFYIGSGQEYGRDHWMPRMEEGYFDTHVPVDQAGFSKYLISRHVSDSRNIINLRCFAVFGRYEDWEIRFISNACCKAVWDMPITIKQNVNYDYLDVQDLCAIAERFITHDAKEKVYNVCSGRVCDLLMLAGEVLAASGKALPVQVAKPGMGLEYSGNNSRLLDELGPLQFTDMDESIRRLYAWYALRKEHIDRRLLTFDK